jgi:Zn-finger protein
MISDEMKGFFKGHQLRILRDLKKQGIIIGQTSIKEIIQATSYKQRKTTHLDSCVCYQSDPEQPKQPPKPCHNLELLNCFLCACPEFDLEAESGGCNVYSRLGKIIDSPIAKTGKIWDCYSCYHPHFPTTVEKYIKENLESLKQKQESIKV